ncbi:MAG: DUF3326 domain-containing protein [Candidatus Marinimicrobia bacterium]|nr:DUF3326 domain-containing protein [Candidatus Neomarinimicrobiota bacterium]
MITLEKEFTAPRTSSADLLAYFKDQVQTNVDEGDVPIRFAVTATTDDEYHYEVGLLTGQKDSRFQSGPSIFESTKRQIENTKQFNVVLTIPTGIGAELGGHDGDAGSLAKLIAANCDQLITHPNVVNASDINELPENGLYVEGSVLSRFMLGSIGLQPVRSNRVLVVVDAHPDQAFVNAAINAVSAARASYGLDCPQVVQMDPPIELTAQYSESGRAVGRIDGFKALTDILDKYQGDYDAVALASVIYVPYSYHTDYFDQKGEMVNPWGGVEAMLTHTISEFYNIPSAHAPMFENQQIANMDPGVVDPRMAAEAISLTFLQSVLKGLQRSPRIVTDPGAMKHHSVLSAADISCLVIPDGVLGLPTLAALEQGIPVIAVKENKNLMRNDLTALPWALGQLHIVDNYWEAMGVLSALTAGISPESVRRPLSDTKVIGKKMSVSVDLDENLDEFSGDDSTRLTAKEEKSSSQ